MQKHEAKRKRKVTWKRGPLKYPGISRHAEELGVQRSTLYRYLEGIWEFPPETKRRYEEILEAQDAIERGGRG